MPSPFRGLVLDEQFEAEFKQLEPDDRTRDEILEGIDWVLSREPQKGSFSEGEGVWIREVCDPKTRRRFWLFYTFTERHVILISIKKPSASEIWPN